MLTLGGILDYVLTKLLVRFSPNHIAIILDGNRRYAKLKGITQMEGHMEGAFKIKEIVPKLMELNIKYFSMFVFSVENFSRGEESVNETLGVIRDNLLRERSWLNEIGSRVLISGKLEMLPSDLRELLLELESETRNNKGIVFNVCCAYSYTTELEYSINKYLCHCRSKRYTAGDSGESSGDREKETEHMPEHADSYKSECVIDDQIYKDYQYNPQIPFPEILIRTSGETRLSDYLIYQTCHNARIYFVNLLWPQMNNLTVLLVVLHYALFYL